MIHYHSTRGAAPILDFPDVVLAGLARDGGLYVPQTLPIFAPDEIATFSSLSYVALAEKVIGAFSAGSIPPDDLHKLLTEAYFGFRHSAVAPLKQLDANEWLLELFHGPTLAFKDFALQVLGRLLEYFLAKRGETVTIVGATSGDTGSAAIEGCRGRVGMRVFIFYPEGRVSEVQRRQMTTVPDENVHAVAVRGTFDDCQNLVKAMFGDHAFRDSQRLAAVNSINWARILAQVVYYFHAAAALGAPARGFAFSVPTGNFGDIYAGYVARKMGLPIERLIIATNANDILDRCVSEGAYTMTGVSPTLSPSMDIQISSNFERLLFDLHGENGDVTAGLMREFAASGTVALASAPYHALRRLFTSARADDAATLATIAKVYRETGELLDPHTAVGVHAARARREADLPVVTLATAHPAKFPDAVEKAVGIRPTLPPHLADLMTREERLVTLPNDLKAVQQYIVSHG